MYSHIQQQDPEVYDALSGEEERERVGLELIPSENYVSLAVREALGSVLTNKYAEGLPGKRYYGGQMYTDAVENLAIERAKKLFKAGFVNVQPLSGAPANLAMYSALLEPGDTVLGMDLGHGGHLTHGHPMTFPAKVFRFVTYKMKDPDTGEIDYEALAETARKEQPKINPKALSADPREIDYTKRSGITKEESAYAVMDMAHIAGLIAAGVLKNPFDYGFDVITTTTHKTLRGPRGGMILTRESEEIAKKVNKAIFPGLQGGPHMNAIAGIAVALGEAAQPSFRVYAEQVLKNAKAMEAVLRKENIRMLTGGTDNHLILADVFGSLSISGKEAETVLDEVGITLNKNAIADDTRPPLDPSGIRFGTPPMTTRGMKEAEATKVAELLMLTLRNKDDASKKTEIKKEVQGLCEQFPVPESFIK